ncbi:hypothetical protein NPIL_126811 [Nephila pilipes]|uniref:Uncharacterized protein n=1 Tax=Nephila pilipes TaxID=299642 RepID=A0A8X6UU18_NEPPI|nr:hypothetical protein NPIL_126811 [Nephila pilipes]
MKFLYVLLTLCLFAMTVNAADCPAKPCRQGKFCVRVLGSTSCVHPAKYKNACSSEPGRGNVYDLVPPCQSGLTCDTTKTIPVCQ